MKQKNNLQDKLINEYFEMIEILPIDMTGNPSIAIKNEYQFEFENTFYKDACHTIKEKEEVKSNVHITEYPDTQRVSYRTLRKKIFSATVF